MVLPAKCFAEKDGRLFQHGTPCSASARRWMRRANAKDDWWITAQIATRMGYPMEHANAEEIFEEIRTGDPLLRGHHLWKRIKKTKRVYSSHMPAMIIPAHRFYMLAVLPKARGPSTPSTDSSGGKCRSGIPRCCLGRVLYRYHTGTMTMKTEGLNKRVPECFVEVAAANQKYSLEHGGRGRCVTLGQRHRLSFK